jgi:hypothetical protein
MRWLFVTDFDTWFAGPYEARAVDTGAGHDDDDDDEDDEDDMRREVNKVMTESGIDAVVERKSLKRLAALFADSSAHPTPAPPSHHQSLYKEPRRR